MTDPEPLVFVALPKMGHKVDIVPAIKIGEKGDHFILVTTDGIIEYHKESVFYTLQEALDRFRESILRDAWYLYSNRKVILDGVS
jgi:hypothetical protein